MKNKVKEIIFGLCEGRHNMPVKNYIFGTEIEDVHDYNGMMETARNVIESHCGKPIILNHGGSMSIFRNERLVIYATGLTSALLSAINAGYSLGFSDIVVMHYNRETGECNRQQMFVPMW